MTIHSRWIPVLRHSLRVFTAALVSFIARGFASFPTQIWCFTAISSAGLISMLPGHLICKHIHISDDEDESNSMQWLALWTSRAGIKL